MKKFSDTMFDILIVVACIAAVLAGGWYIAHATPQTKETSYIYEERKINRYASPRLVDRVDESESPHIVAEKSGADAVEVPTSELPKQEVKLKAGPAPATESVADSEPGNRLDSEKESKSGPDLSFIPLEQPLAETLLNCCEEYGIPLHLGLGVMEIESNFDLNALSDKDCVGLMQINPRYAWVLEDATGASYLTPEGNIRCGLYYLSSLLTQYGNTAAALCAYHAGHDTGDRTYSNAVLSAAEEWLQYTQTIS